MEEIVVTCGDVLQHVRESVTRKFVERSNVGDVASAANQKFEGPHCPEGHDCDEVFILANQSVSSRSLQLHVIAEQTTVVVSLILR